MAKTKIIKKENGITYLESYDPTKPKRVVSLETRKKLSEKRKSATKQPRSGQSKKAQNLLTQLEKDYLTQQSARGRFTRGKSKYDSDTRDEVDELMQYSDSDFCDTIDESDNEVIKPQKDDFRRYVPITNADKKTIKKWLDKNESKLKAITAKDGILNEYDIQICNFTQIKMTEAIITNIEEANNDHKIESNEIDESMQRQYIMSYRNKLATSLLDSGSDGFEVEFNIEIDKLDDYLESILINENDASKISNCFIENSEYIIEFVKDHITNNSREFYRIAQIVFLFKYYKKPLSNIKNYLAEISSEYQWELINKFAKGIKESYDYNK